MTDTPTATLQGALNVDAARDHGAHLITRAGYAAATGTPKARVDRGVTAYATAIIQALRARLETLQALEASQGRALDLIIQGSGPTTSLTLAIPAGTGQHAPPQLIIPGRPLPDLSSAQGNHADRERVAAARPLALIIKDALTPGGIWDANLTGVLQDLSVHPGAPDVLITIATRSLTYSPHVQRLLQRESIRPVYHLNEAELAPARTTTEILALRAGLLIDKHYPLPVTSDE